MYLYYAMQAPRERPGGYSSVAPEAALRTYRALAPCPSAGELDRLGIRFVTVLGRPRCPVPGELLARDGRSVGELAQALPISRPAVSRHLRLLPHRSAGRPRSGASRSG